MDFTFVNIRKFDSVSIHINNHYSKDIQIFSRAKENISLLKTNIIKFPCHNYTLTTVFNCLTCWWVDLRKQTLFWWLYLTQKKGNIPLTIDLWVDLIRSWNIFTRFTSLTRKESLETIELLTISTCQTGWWRMQGTSPSTCMGSTGSLWWSNSSSLTSGC